MELEKDMILHGSRKQNEHGTATDHYISIIASNTFSLLQIIIMMIIIIYTYTLILIIIIIIIVIIINKINNNVYDIF